jgi:hypothetical protein
MSPFEKLYGRKPSANKLCPFGCLAYVFQHESKRKKLDSKSIPCSFRATLEHGNYRVYDLATKKVYVSRHVVFSETEFPACILTKMSRAEDTESQSDYSDSGISLGKSTHSSSGNDSEASSQFEGDEEASADGEKDQDDEEGQDDEQGKLDEERQVENDQGGAGESADDEYAAQLSPSIGTHRNPAEKSQHRYPSRERKQPSRFWVNTAIRATCHDIDN